MAAAGQAFGLARAVPGIKTVKSNIARHKNIQHKDKSNKTVRRTHPLCLQSAECEKFTTGKMRNDSVEKSIYYPLPIFRIANF